MGRRREKQKRRSCRSPLFSYASSASRAAINPRQIPLINEYFSPSQAEIDEAHAILEALERAKRMGRGVITLGNRMIDAPDILKARRILEAEQQMKGVDYDEE